MKQLCLPAFTQNDNLQISVDCGFRGVYVLLGNYDISLLLFLKGDGSIKSM